MYYEFKSSAMTKYIGHINSLMPKVGDLSMHAKDKYMQKTKYSKETTLMFVLVFLHLSTYQQLTLPNTLNHKSISLRG